MVAATGPTRGDKRAHERTQTAPAQQDAHSEHCSTCRVHAVPMHREFSFAHYRKHYPARTDHQLSRFGEDSRQQRAVIAHVADAFEHRREIEQIARLERRRRFCMWLGEVHSADK